LTSAARRKRTERGGVEEGGGFLLEEGEGRFLKER